MESITANPKLLVALLFSFIGFILSIIGILNYRKAKNSICWPTAIGTILTSDVKKETSSSSNNGTVTTYKPEICYSYKVEGVESSQIESDLYSIIKVALPPKHLH
ncbi:MAG: DUF3592 domain-containing protein [Bacteroidales bacterium]|nr:DUF3592 domain-containing protein [Bacteroidales bacterium]